MHCGYFEETLLPISAVLITSQWSHFFLAFANQSCIWHFIYKYFVYLNKLKNIALIPLIKHHFSVIHGSQNVEVWLDTSTPWTEPTKNLPVLLKVYHRISRASKVQRVQKDTLGRELMNLSEAHLSCGFFLNHSEAKQWQKYWKQASSFHFSGGSGLQGRRRGVECFTGLYSNFKMCGAHIREGARESGVLGARACLLHLSLPPGWWEVSSVAYRWTAHS